MNLSPPLRLSLPSLFLVYSLGDLKQDHGVKDCVCVNGSRIHTSSLDLASELWTCISSYICDLRKSSCDWQLVSIMSRPLVLSIVKIPVPQRSSLTFTPNNPFLLAVQAASLGSSLSPSSNGIHQKNFSNSVFKIYSEYDGFTLVHCYPVQDAISRPPT